MAHPDWCLETVAQFILNRVPLADGLLSVLSPTSPGHPERVLLTVSRSHREATQLTSFLCEEQHLHLTYARSAYSQKSSH